MYYAWDYIPHTPVAKHNGLTNTCTKMSGPFPISFRTMKHFHERANGGGT